MNNCSRCGTDNNYNAKFCRGCGMVLEGNQGAATIPYKRHNALLIGLGIGVGIVVLIVIGLLFFLPPHNPLVGKWESIDGGEDFSFWADGTSTSEEGGKYTYKTQDDTVLLYQNGQLINEGQYSIEGNTLTLETSESTFRFKKIE